MGDTSLLAMGGRQRRRYLLKMNYKVEKDELESWQLDFNSFQTLGIVGVDRSGKVSWDGIRFGRYYRMYEAIDREVLYYENGKLIIRE